MKTRKKSKPKKIMRSLSDRAYSQLLNEVFFLIRVLGKSNPVGVDEVLTRLKTSINYPHDLVSENMPDAEGMELAIHAFFLLPEKVRRRALRGWTLERQPSIGDLDAYNTGEYQSFLWIAGDKPTKNGFPDADFRHVPSDSSESVQVLIRPGTTQTEALEAIERVHEAIAVQWSQLIVEPTYLPPGLKPPAK